MNTCEYELALKIAELLSDKIEFKIFPIAPGQHESGHNPTNPSLTRHPKVLYTMSRGSEVLLTLDEHIHCSLRIEDEKYEGMTEEVAMSVVEDILGVLECIPGSKIIFASMVPDHTASHKNVSVRVSSTYNEMHEYTTFKVELLFAVFS